MTVFHVQDIQFFMYELEDAAVRSGKSREEILASVKRHLDAEFGDQARETTP